MLLFVLVFFVIDLSYVVLVLYNALQPVLLYSIVVTDARRINCPEMEIDEIGDSECQTFDSLRCD